MENITIGQVAIALAFLVGLIGSVKYLLNELNIRIDKTLKPINSRISELELSNIKTDLVDFINDLEHDVPKSQIQKLNAHELYDRYTKLGGNSYVHEHWEKLKKEGKLWI